MSPAASNAFGNPYSFTLGEGWGTRLMLSVGMAGFLSLMGILSFPLPWTPVPFSMMPMALLITGAYQRPGYAGLSVVIYLLAGAMGAPIYADGSSGWAHLVGPTSGYLFGYVLVSVLVGWYMGRPRRFLPPIAAKALLVVLGIGVLAGATAIGWMSSSGTDLGTMQAIEGFGLTASALWIFIFLTAVCAAASFWFVKRRKGEEPQALNLYLVMLASIVVLHICGVTVLKFSYDMAWMPAIILGSVVFLPFDAVKAGIGVAASLPFVPTPTSELEHA